MLADFAHRTHQRIQLDGAASFHVLQHGGLERAQAAGDGVAVVRGLVNAAADALANGLGFPHHGAAIGAHQRVVQNLVARCAGEGRHRVHGHVAPQLEPDVALYAPGHGDGKTRLRQQRGHGLHTGAIAPVPGCLRVRAGLATGRLADDELVVFDAPQPPRCRRRCADMHHAAQHAGRGQGLGSEAIRVHGAQRQPGAFATQAVEKPPRHAVHGHQHHRVGCQQRLNLLRHLGHGRAFDGHDHQILRPQCRRAVAGVQGQVVRGASVICPAQAFGLQGRQGLAPCQCRQPDLPGGQARTQPRGKHTADGPHADDGDSGDGWKSVGSCCGHAGGLWSVVSGAVKRGSGWGRGRVQTKRKASLPSGP